MEIQTYCVRRYFLEAMGTAHIHIADGNTDGLCLNFFAGLKYEISCINKIKSTGLWHIYCQYLQV